MSAMSVLTELRIQAFQALDKIGCIFWCYSTVKYTQSLDTAEMPEVELQALSHWSPCGTIDNGKDRTGSTIS